MLEVHDLTARRGHATLFSGVSFQLAAGQALALTGPNGSGKTTLLRILAGLTSPAAGTVRWRGKDVAPFAPCIRQDTLLSAHVPALKDELSAAENLSLQCALTGHRVADYDIRVALDAIGLGTAQRLPAAVLSQGQRRRIGLARLLLVRRPLWLLDEPTTALDVAGMAQLGRLLGDHLESGGVVVATTHQALDIPADRLKSLALA